MRTSMVRIVNPPKFDGPPEVSPPLVSRRLKKMSDRSLEVDEPTTIVYRHAREQEWDDLERAAKRHPSEVRYISPKDRTTALHLAVMSRTGYSMDGSIRQQRPAPISIIETLLILYPEAAKITCQINTYTPLAYACLVSGDHYNLEDSEAIVRLFLKYCPESTTVFTAGGLSPLDVHIVSYSRAVEGDAEEDTLSGRTSTLVLRALLESDSTLADARITQDKVSGPIELLYRCNSASFLKLSTQNEIKKTSNSAGQVDEPEDKNAAVIAQVTTWWVWKWTILILKYGTLRQKKKGARFLALQAAAGLIGCPLPVLTLAMKAFPKQIREIDEMHGNDGNLPLHEVCMWPCEQDCRSTDPVVSSRKGIAVSALLKEYPNAASIRNRHLEYPLEIALASGTTWDGGVRKLVKACPGAVSVQSQKTGLYPFMTAAVAARIGEQYQISLSPSKRSLMTHLQNVLKKDVQSVRTIYGLVRMDPMVLIDCFEGADEQARIMKEARHG